MLSCGADHAGVAELVDATDLVYLSTQREIFEVNGVKVGEILTGHADGYAELKFVDADSTNEV